MHQTVGNVLRMYLYSNLPNNMTQARDIIDQALTTTMHVMQTTIATMPDWKAITSHCKQHGNDNLCHTNKKQCQYDYALGQTFLEKVHDPTKLGSDPFLLMILFHWSPVKASVGYRHGLREDPWQMGFVMEGKSAITIGIWICITYIQNTHQF
eukprot:9654221-Ditylum_brightwellii.AAC.1